eukprot:SAG11_NODE_5483_length_1548_cov_1.146308_1_plen_87_part_00
MGMTLVGSYGRHFLESRHFSDILNLVPDSTTGSTWYLGTTAVAKQTLEPDRILGKTSHHKMYENGYLGILLEVSRIWPGILSLSKK